MRKYYEMWCGDFGGGVPASCLDCKKPYSEFGMDILLPRGQWLAINPNERGLLCAQCIVNRAEKLNGAIVIHAVIEMAIPTNPTP